MLGDIFKLFYYHWHRWVNRHEKVFDYPPTIASSSVDRNSLSISVIIPCYNEQESIEATLKSVLQNSSNVQIIIGDGGSSDSTQKICRIFLENLSPAHQHHLLIDAGKTRAQCMNNGAKLAAGDILLFLHADSELPYMWDKPVQEVFGKSNDDTMLGCFEFAPRSFLLQNSISMRFITHLTNFRSRYFSMPYGDQALFLRKSTFISLNGFPNIPFMEDYEFVQRLWRVSRSPYSVATVREPVWTSARRWEINGVLWNSFINQVIIIGYRCGVSHERLAKWYYGATQKKTY